MKYVLSDNLITFAHKVSRIPGMKKCLKPFYYSYKQTLENKRRKLFLKNAYSVMADFDDALSSIGVNYSLAFGTLLGAVREGGFIKHDLDLDTAIWYEDYSSLIQEVLESHGFILSHSFMLEGGKKGMEETYVKDDVSVDIFYVYSAINHYPYMCLWSAVEGTTTVKESMQQHGFVEVGRLELPFSKETQRIKFGPLQLPAITNRLDFLEKRYGPNYMIPDPTWQLSTEDTCYVMWNGKMATYIEY